MKIKPILATLCALTVVTASAFGSIAFLTSRDSVANTFTVGNIELELDETKVNPDGTIEYDTDGDGDTDVIVDPSTGDITDTDGNDVSDDYTYNEDDNTITPADGSDPIQPGETEGNEYNLVPNKEYVKDPTVTIKQNSEKAYVRMIVTVTAVQELEVALGKTFELTDIVPEVSTDWMLHGSEYIDDGKAITIEYRYPGIVEGAAEDFELPALFTHIKVPGTFTGDHLQSLVDAGFRMDIEAHAMQAATFENDVNAAWEAFDGQMNP